MTFLIAYFWTCILLLCPFLDLCLESVSYTDKVKFRLISYDMVLDITNNMIYDEDLRLNL